MSQFRLFLLFSEGFNWAFLHGGERLRICGLSNNHWGNFTGGTFEFFQTRKKKKKGWTAGNSLSVSQSNPGRLVQYSALCVGNSRYLEHLVRIHVFFWRRPGDGPYMFGWRGPLPRGSGRSICTHLQSAAYPPLPRYLLQSCLVIYLPAHHMPLRQKG